MTTQSEAALENGLIKTLQNMSYEFVEIREESNMLANFKTQYEKLIRAFDDMGIVIDRACGDVCRLRCQSYDIHQYVNMNAKPFAGIYREPKSIFPSYSYDYDVFDSEDKVANLCREISQQHIDLTGTYDDWVKIGAALSSLGESGRQWFHLCSSQNSGYNAAECDHKFDNLLRSNRRIGIGTFFHYCKNAGLEVKEFAIDILKALRAVYSFNAFLYSVIVIIIFANRIANRNFYRFLQ